MGSPSQLGFREAGCPPQIRLGMGQAQGPGAEPRARAFSSGRRARPGRSGQQPTQASCVLCPWVSSPPSPDTTNASNRKVGSIHQGVLRDPWGPEQNN